MPILSMPTSYTQFDLLNEGNDHHMQLQFIVLMGGL
jgi:hypothetical protein